MCHLWCVRDSRRTEETLHEQRQQQTLTLNAKCWTKTLNATMPLFAWMRRGSAITACDLFGVRQSMVSFTSAAAAVAWWSVQSPFSVITSLWLLLIMLDWFFFLALLPFDCFPFDIILWPKIVDALLPLRWCASNIVWSPFAENLGEFNPFFGDGGGGDVDWLVSEMRNKKTNCELLFMNLIRRTL